MVKRRRPRQFLWMPATFPPLRSCGRDLKTDALSMGKLTDSSALSEDFDALRRRMEEDGYLFLRNVLDPQSVHEARAEFIAQLEEKGALQPGLPAMDGVLRENTAVPALSPGFAQTNRAVHRVVFGPEIKNFYTGFLGGPIRHFDFIWVRSMGHGKGTPPHCDLVYMGRGTHRLYTAWIPYGDVPYELGGLMVLEKSHLQSDRIKNYLEHDVDSYCLNAPGRGDGWKRLNGALSTNPASLQQKFGGRWLTTEFRMGDLLTFRMDLIHASTDNQTNRIRLSTDTRYQRSDEPVDERWVGENPVGHGKAGKLGRIC